MKTMLCLPCNPCATRRHAHRAKLGPVALAAALAVGTPLAAVAQADAPEQVVISATRTANPLSRVPASVSLVDREAFSAQQAGTVGDVLKKLPNVDFGGGPRSDGLIPTVRGYQGNDLILLVDGARRNANYSLTTPLFIDPYFLAQAEVVRGSASSLYGSGGNGGAMVFTTLSAADLLKPGQTLGAQARAGYASGDDNARFNARVFGRQGGFDALVAAGYQAFEDLRQADGSTLQLNAGHGHSGLVKLGWQPHDRLRLELSQQAFIKQTLEPNNPQLVTTTQTQLTRNKQDETVLRAVTFDAAGDKAKEARLYQTRTVNQRDRNGTLPYWSSTIETTGLSAQNTVRLGTGMHRVTYGLDAYRDRLTTVSGTGPNVANPDGQARVTGAFVQDEIALGQAWRLTPSLRYDHFSNTPANAALAAASHSHVSPKLAVAWLGGPALMLYGSLGQSYRAPSIWETYASTLTNGAYPTTNFNNFAANPGLKPQTDSTVELGLRQSMKGALLPGDQLQVQATAFHAKAKNLMTQVTIGSFTRTGFLQPGTKGSILQTQNVAQATRQGLELGARWQRQGWTLDAGYSRLRVTDDTTGAHLFAPPDKLTVQLGTALPMAGLRLRLGTTAVAAQDDDSTVARRRSGYAVHEVGATWQSPGQAWRVDFGIGNLADKLYRSYQSGNAAAALAYELGRHYNLSVSGAF